jgi:uncharacterized protein (TIGR02246 family)
MHTTADIKAIENANLAIYQSFETGDFKSASLHLTEDCDYITFNGTHTKGREAYIQLHEELMNNFMFRGAKLEGEIEQMRFLNDSTVVVIASGGIKFRWQKQMPKGRKSVNTTVWVKSGKGQWQMAAFHNCRVKKMSGFAKWVMGIEKSEFAALVQSIFFSVIL